MRARHAHTTISFRIVGGRCTHGIGLESDHLGASTIERLADLRLGSLAQWLTGVTCFLAAVAVGMEFQVIPRGHPFMTFFPAVAIATLLAGWQIGVIVTFASTLAVGWLFIRPLDASEIGLHTGDVLALVGFLGVAALEIAITSALRRALVRMEKQRVGMQALIASERGMQTELEHRVANTLQSISNALERQARAASDTATKMVLDEAIGRVAIFARIHRRISRPDTDIGGFLEALCHDLLGAFEATHLRATVEADPIELGARRAETVALITAEALTNSIKHAYPDRAPGKVSVSLRKHGPLCVLEVSDDGVGIGPSADTLRSGSLGLSVIRTMTQRLGGNVTWAGPPGTVVRVEFPGHPAPPQDDH